MGAALRMLACALALAGLLSACGGGGGAAGSGRAGGGAGGTDAATTLAFTTANANWSLELGSADGQALRPGIYANAYSSSWFQRPAGVPTLDFGSGQIRPSSVQGEFVSHELEVDGAGRITRLALDFTAPQRSGPVSSSGAIRINSAWALAP